MEHQQLEEAIKSDLRTIPTLKMGGVSAKDFYIPVLVLIFKISLIFLAINTGVRLVLQAVGLYHPTITMGLMFGTWSCAFVMSLMLGVTLSRFVLLKLLFKGRLKTEALIKQKITHLSLLYFGIYAVVYCLMTALINSGMGFDEHVRDAGMVVFSTIFSQVFAFVVSSVAAGFLSMIELDRLGMGILFNAIGEMINRVKKRDVGHRHLNDREHP
jgi:hypothetical protein